MKMRLRSNTAGAFGKTLGANSRRELVSLLCVVVCACSSSGVEPAAPSQSATGTIRGKVVYVADPQRPWRLGRYYIGNPRSGELAEAVVAISKRRLQAPDGDHKPSMVTVDQKNFQFVPETVAIRAGDRVRFLNSDDHVHNVRAFHPKHSFNVNMPAGSEHQETFPFASGIHQPYRIECVYHSAMRAWVFVFNHPWFAVTGKDGAFELRNVVPGDYRLEVFHPAGNLRTTEKIEVVAGKETELVIRLQPQSEESDPNQQK